MQESGENINSRHKRMVFWCVCLHVVAVEFGKQPELLVLKRTVETEHRK